MSDRLSFSIDGVRKTAETMRENNTLNKKNKEAFLNYIDNNLVPEWNTPQGQVAIEELKAFVNGQYQEYVDYLDGKIDALENVVIPALERINNA